MVKGGSRIYKEEKQEAAILAELMEDKKERVNDEEDLKGANDENRPDEEIARNFKWEPKSPEYEVVEKEDEKKEAD